MIVLVMAAIDWVVEKPNLTSCVYCMNRPYGLLCLQLIHSMVWLHRSERDQRLILHASTHFVSIPGKGNKQLLSHRNTLQSSNHEVKFSETFLVMLRTCLCNITVGHKRGIARL